MSVYPRILWILLGTACLMGVACVQPLLAEQWVAPRDQHPWGSFPIGTWKLVKVTTLGYNERGEVVSQSLTTTRSQLESVSDEGFTLRVEVTVEVNGKEFTAMPKVVTRSFGRPPTADSREGMEVLSIGDERLQAEVHRWVREEEGVRFATTVHLTPGCPPYLLRRRTLCTSASGTMRHYETLVEVTRLAAEAEVLGKPRRAWHVRTIHQTPETRDVIDEVHCEEIPDGVVTRISRRENEAGKLVETSRQELLQFEVPGTMAQNRRHIFPRRRRHP